MKLKTSARFGSLVTGLAGWVGIVLAPQAQAALLLYEGFDYGSSPARLNAVSGAALGLDGSGYTGADNVQYQSAGLTFGSLVTSGGKANLGYNGSAFYATRGLDFSLTTGTLYGSYLFRAYDDAGGDGGISPVMFGSSVNDNTSELAVAGNTAGTGGISAGLKTYGNSVIASGISQAVNSTYLVLFQVDNLAATAGQTQNINLWVLSMEQFENFKLGGLTMDELQAADLGQEATNVWQRLSYTLNVAGSNKISLADTDSLTLFSYRSKYEVDEIRISSASLDEVTPVPEPVSVALIVGGLGVLALRKRRPAR
jgi:hypothetical protein